MQGICDQYKEECDEASSLLYDPLPCFSRTIYNVCGFWSVQQIIIHLASSARSFLSLDGIPRISKYPIFTFLRSIFNCRFLSWKNSYLSYLNAMVYVTEKWCTTSHEAYYLKLSFHAFRVLSMADYLLVTVYFPGSTSSWFVYCQSCLKLKKWR